MTARSLLPLLPVLILLSFARPAAAAGVRDDGHPAPLPPVIPWNGASRALVVEPDHPWITPCERSGLMATPRYDETVQWLRRLTSASPELHLVSLGRSHEGRDIWMVVASLERAFTPEAMHATGKPILFAHAGIHAGEIDGKDAGLMLLRDMTVRGAKRDLLAGAHLLFIPILNVDGHERFTPHGRINQRGPVEMGWRTNARNLNLNRDFAKLDTPEVRAVVRALDTWKPDLYCDLHVTDGIDYQYDITFGFTGSHGFSPAIAGWLERSYRPAVTRDLQAAGHIPGPLIFAADDRDLSRGIVEWTAGPRFSNGYGDLRHQPAVLLENHSLKPYDQRVLGTYVFLEATLRVLAREAASLRKSIEADRKRRPEALPIAWRPSPDPGTIEFLAITRDLVPSEVSGGEWTRWTGKPETLTVPYVRLATPARTLVRPPAYWIPPSWPEVIERLVIHGVAMERIGEPREVEVDLHRIVEHELQTTPFEGHVGVRAKTELERQRRVYSPGSVRVSTDQPLGDLAILLLEPDSPDSFFQWGFFLEILQRTEYVEAYAMEPLAGRMLEEDPDLRKEFEEKLARDEAFAKDPRERLQWLYRRTPYYDAEHLLYPVGREVGE